MNRTWYILVADSGAAKLFRAQGQLKDLELLHARSNPAGPARHAGVTRDRALLRPEISQRHASRGADEVRQHENEQFARELCRVLDREQAAHHFTDLLIAAPPQFMGKLRHHLSRDCRKAVARSVDKDLLAVPAPELPSYFG